MPESHSMAEAVQRGLKFIKPGSSERCLGRMKIFAAAAILCFVMNPASFFAMNAAAQEPAASQTSGSLIGDGAVEIKLVPEQVELPFQGASVSALLIVRNASGAPISDIQIKPIYNEAEIRVESDLSLSQDLKIVSGEEQIWAIKISNAGGVSSSETVIFLARFLRQQGSKQASPDAAYGLLPVKRLPATEIADVTPRTVLESLDSQHPGKIYLVVANKINQPITVKKILTEGPNFISFETPMLNGPSEEGLIVPPLESRIIPIEVKAQKRVQPGKHVLAFTAQMEFEMAGRPLTRNVVLTQNVDVDVLGQSLLLKILSVPSFFLIPGILAVITWGLLWKWGFMKLKRDKGEFLPDVNQDPKSAQFWVISVTFSILIIMAYQLYQPGVLTAYGLQDFVYLWFLSVFIVGFGGYLAIAGGRRRFILRRTPSAKDSAVAIIEKLSRQGLNVFRNIVTVTEAGKSVEAFALQEMKPEASDSETLWVGPGIEVSWKRGAPAELKGQVDEELKLKGDAKHLARLLKTAMRKNMAIVAWKKPSEESTEISSISEVKSPDYKISQSKDCMVEVTTE